MSRRRKRKRDEDENDADEATEDVGESFLSPRKRAIPDGKFQWKDRVATFAKTVDRLAETSADILTFGATRGIKHNIMSKLLLGESEQAEEEDHGSSSSWANDNFDDDEGDSQADAPVYNFSRTESKPRRRGFGFGGGRRRQLPEESSEDEDSGSEDEDDQGEAPSKGVFGGKPKYDVNSPTHSPEKTDAAGAESTIMSDISDFNTGPVHSGGKGKMTSVGRFGTLCLGLALAICWAIILLAIPLLPVLIASWLVSDFISQNVFPS